MTILEIYLYLEVIYVYPVFPFSLSSIIIEPLAKDSFSSIHILSSPHSLTPPPPIPTFPSLIFFIITSFTFLPPAFLHLHLSYLLLRAPHPPFSLTSPFPPLPTPPPPPLSHTPLLHPQPFLQLGLTSLPSSFLTPLTLSLLILSIPLPLLFLPLASFAIDNRKYFAIGNWR